VVEQQVFYGNIVEKNPKLKVAILERGADVLQKSVFLAEDVATLPMPVLNLTNWKYYPRGEKELRGPFHQFVSGDTIEWFEKHG
jgi:hypothetical protein